MRDGFDNFDTLFPIGADDSDVEYPNTPSVSNPEQTSSKDHINTASLVIAALSRDNLLTTTFPLSPTYLIKNSPMSYALI